LDALTPTEGDTVAGSISVDSSLSGGHRVVTVTGEIDIATGPVLREQLLALVDDGDSDIVIDLGQVPFLDSSGLGVLVAAYKRARSAGGQLRLAGCRPAVETIFQITALDRAFPIYPTVADAVRDAEPS
jgi:anti-sigma B factor antagonist